MLILAVVIVLITGNTHLFESQSKIYTYMSDAAALQVGAPVNLDGIPIGKVTAIVISGSKDPMRLVRVEMEVPDQRLGQIPLDSLSSISSANVLGTKYINIKSGKSDNMVRAGQEIPALNTAGFDDVVQQGYSILTALQGMVSRVDKIVGLVEAGQGSIGKLLVDETLYNKVLAVVDQVQRLSDIISSDKGTLGKLLNSPEMYDDIRASLTKVDTLVQGLQDGQGTAGKLLKDPALYDELQKTTAEIHKIVTDLNEGKGTAGKLLKSEDLSNQLHDTIARVDTLMGKVSSLMDKVNSGQGTLGQLVVNPQLYDNLAGTTKEMEGLMKDFRANPKKFLRIKLAIF